MRFKSTQTVEKLSLNNISVCAYYHHGPTVAFSVANLIFQEQVADAILCDHLGQCFTKFWRQWTAQARTAQLS